MIRLRIFIFFILTLFCQFNLHAQGSINNQTVTYETLYDDPYDINKLYIQIQPLYGEFYMTNVTIGFGLEADYYLKDKFDFNVNFRKAYSQKFDMMRDASEKNNNALNSAKNFYYLEGGATYHIVDREEDSKSKFILYSKNYKKRNKWETMVPQYIEAPTKRRRIYGARLGGSNYQSSIDVNRALENQGHVLTDSAGNALSGDLSMYSNLTSSGFYIGGALQLIKNVGISFDKTYGNSASDLDFLVYADILVNPFTTLDDAYYKADADSPEIIYNLDIIETNMIGGRAGIKGKFNRDLSFGYNIEMGYRPGIKGQNVYFLAKISFPVIGTKLSREVEAFGL